MRVTCETKTRKVVPAEGVFQDQALEEQEHSAGEIAHELNNVLSIIDGFTRITMKGMGKDDAHYKNLERVRRAVQRGMGLTREFLGPGDHGSDADESVTVSNQFPDLRVLVVEDNEDARAIMRASLSELGVTQVFEAQDGRSALAFMDSAFDYVDMVICDWNMPSMTGMEFLRQLRTVNDKVPFLMVTGRSDESSVVEARAAGVTAYVRKPFTPVQLEAKLSIMKKREIL